MLHKCLLFLYDEGDTNNICKTVKNETAVNDCKTQSLQLLFYEIIIPKASLFFGFFALATENQVYNNTKNQCTRDNSDGNLTKA